MSDDFQDKNSQGGNLQGNALTGDAASGEETLSGASRIEGGVDALVVGATLDGLVAAAYLGKAGLKTVLLEAGVRAPEKTEFAEGYFADDHDLLVRDLDPDVISGLDLYRHGLCYVQRRFESMYYFKDRSTLLINGDLALSYEAVAEIDRRDADAFQDFMQDLMGAALDLRPLFMGTPLERLSKRARAYLKDYASISVDAVLDRFFKDARVKDLLRAEASFHAGLRPSDPYSYLSLVRRWSGEAAGLQGACAFPSGGYGGVYSALRRAVQSAGVEFRAGSDITSMLVEWDGVAGVSVADGGQIRAGVVVNALSSRDAFMGQIGPSQLDIEFQKAITAPPPRYASAKVHFALKGAARDEVTRKNLSRRLVYTPDQLQLRTAYRMARDDEVAPDLQMELIFPSVFENGWAPEHGNLAAGWVHPIPYRPGEDEALRQEVERAALATFENIAPGASDRLEAMDVRLAADRGARSGLAPQSLAGFAPVLQEAQRAHILRDASGLNGFFYCGPDAQIGQGASGGASGAAGRMAGRLAAKMSRQKGLAA